MVNLVRPLKQGRAVVVRGSCIGLVDGLKCLEDGNTCEISTSIETTKRTGYYKYLEL